MATVPVCTLLLTYMASALWIPVEGSYSCPSAKHTAAHTAPDPHARHAAVQAEDTAVQAEDTASSGSSQEDASAFMVSLHVKLIPTQSLRSLASCQRPVPGILRAGAQGSTGNTARQE